MRERCPSSTLTAGRGGGGGEGREAMVALELYYTCHAVYSITPDYEAELKQFMYTKFHRMHKTRTTCIWKLNL